MVAPAWLLYRRRIFVLALAISLATAGTVISPSPASAAACNPTVTTLSDAVVVSFNDVGNCDWTVPDGVTTLTDVLIIGGGGGGGFDIGGGGGAGGFIALSNVTVTPGDVLPVSVGSGGVGNSGYPTNPASDGEASTFLGNTALGGGAGGSGGENGKNGGSGGGAGYGANSRNYVGGTAQQVAPGLGSDGGGSLDGDTSGAGGGGAGGAGQAAAVGGVRDQGGAGGAGVSSAITGTVRFYAGGGGGGSQPGGSVTTGGSGVGGNGGKVSGPQTDSGDGAANTGSGGGGGGSGSVASVKNGGDGGSGVVILRYGEAAPPSPGVQSAPVAHFALQYDANGGTCTVATSGPIPDGVWIQVPFADQCARVGYYLLGWNPRADGGDPLGFDPGGWTLMTGDNTLYAIWLPRT
jgi:hypothetical protein